MTPKELETRFPRLYRILNELSFDNDCTFRKS